VRPIGFTGGRLDRADHLRGRPEALAALAADPNARLLKLDALDPALDEGGRLVWTTLAGAAPDGDLVLLGLEDGHPRFTEVRPVDRSAPRSPALFRMLEVMAAEDAATYGTARTLVDWHARHRFCAHCGQPTGVFRAGWGRKCPACGTDHFPRVDPVVIMIAEHDGRALLGRQAPWPQGRYSALAGFVEPGESIEEAVAREVLEEAGVIVTDVRYVASQPWPFPGQLMIACIGRAQDDALTIDRAELEDAMWVSRQDVRAALAGETGAPFVAPPPYAIAWSLLATWAAASD
jgi:NAD+ diphosphatase